MTYRDSLRDEYFKEKLGAISVKSLIRTAKERRPSSIGIAEAMVIEYNGKKKGAAYMLPLKKLYEKEPRHRIGLHDGIFHIGFLSLIFAVSPLGCGGESRTHGSRFMTPA